MRNLSTEPACDVLEKMDDKEDNQNLERILTARKAALSDLRVRLQELRLFCESGGEAVSTTVVEVVELARESVEAKRINAILSKHNET